jgi:hypothetical protein
MPSAARTLGSNTRNGRPDFEGRTWPNTLAGGLDESQDRRSDAVELCFPLFMLLGVLAAACVISPDG